MYDSRGAADLLFTRPLRVNIRVFVSLTFPMASVWCCVQICSLLTQCCLSLASVAARGKNKKAKPCYARSYDNLIQFLRASASPAADNGKHWDQYCMTLMDGDEGARELPGNDKVKMKTQT